MNAWKIQDARGQLRNGREGHDLVRRTEEPHTAADLVNFWTPRYVAVAMHEWTEAVDVPCREPRLTIRSRSGPCGCTWCDAIGTALRRATARAPLPRPSQLPQASTERDTQEVALPRAADRREHPFLSNELWASPDKEVGAAIEASCTLSRRFSPLCSPSIRTTFMFAGLRTSRGFGKGGGVSGHSCISQQGGRAGRR